MSQVQSAPLDAAILSVYSRISDAIDDILVNPSNAEQFAGAVRSESKELSSFDTETILRRAISLRKLGEESGGLPRKRRKYRGRRAK